MVKLQKKQFDEMATREGWKKAHNIDDTPPTRRRLDKKTRQVEVIHDTALFERLRKRLILDTTRQHSISTQKKELLNSNKDY